MGIDNTHDRRACRGFVVRGNAGAKRNLEPIVKQSCKLLTVGLRLQSS